MLQKDRLRDFNKSINGIRLLVRVLFFSKLLLIYWGILIISIGYFSWFVSHVPTGTVALHNLLHFVSLYNIYS